jgi:hypothetical protein
LVGKIMVRVFIVVLVVGQLASRPLLPLGVKVAPAGVLPMGKQAFLICDMQFCDLSIFLQRKPVSK